MLTYDDMRNLSEILGFGGNNWMDDDKTDSNEGKIENGAEKAVMKT